MKYLFLLSLAGLTLMVSCKKKGDNQQLNSDNQVSVDFMSTKEGSWWQYNSSDGNQYKRAATGRDSFKAGLTYNYYESTDLNSGHITPEYFGKNNDKYLMLVDLSGTESNYMAAVLSKDNPVVGETFENTGSFTISGFPIDTKIEGEITAVNLTMTVNNNTFNNVVEVTNTLKAKPTATPLFTNCGTVTLWYSYGVGVLKEDFDIHILSLYNRHYTDSLIDYHIEP